ncbi:MAG TPA: SMC family ATPase [Anaerolineae bacterium]|nr:SMC family ATPase [Anaerolineae bacterium]
MIPVKLAIRNFMCYGDQVSSLDFSGIHLACVAGDNGHGKSAIIDAMTWALWGKARTQRDDDLIHLGQRHMEVEFEFVLGDNHYRVLRQRQKNGTKGQTTLEFQVLDDDNFRPLTANTVRQTQAAITETLRMEYETFINSAFLLQGRADEFTSHPPAERKRILGEILDLSHYDRLEERAKERARETEARLREIKATLSEVDRELAHKPEYQRDLSDAEEVSSGLQSRLLAQEATLRELREQKKELELRQDQLSNLVPEKERRDSELSDTKQYMERTRQGIAGYQEILDRGQEIEEGYAALSAARKDDEELSLKLTQHSRLNEQRAEVQRAIDGTAAQLSVERERTAARADGLHKTIAQAEATEKKLAEVRERLAQLDERQAAREELLQQEQELSNQVASLRSQNERLKSEMDHLKDKLDLLEEAEATCPLCGSELQAEERKHIEESYAAEGREKGDLFRDNSASIKRLEHSLHDTRQAREASEADLTKLASLQGQEASLSRMIEDAQAAKVELEEVTDRLARLDQQLESCDFAHENRQRLAKLERELEQVGYDAQKHEEIRRVLSETAHFERERRELDAAMEGMRAQRDKLRERERRLESLQEALQDLAQRTRILSEQVAQLKKDTQDLEDQARLVQDLQVQDADARVRLGAARQKLDHCSYLEQQKKNKSVEERETQEEKTIYDELRLAFGKRGIQAMIIEAVIPEIEEEANRLLGRMTEGRLSVRLKSQRETLQGKTVETLDIEVADELGPRSYSLFSGGEAFRINFAIRVALSKLLARRAGARLQTLIVDEGFGTQDAQGRERLVEAIGSVQEDFERILVITHIEELKDSFPVRIDVVKTPTGSQISVV